MEVRLLNLCSAESLQPHRTTPCQGVSRVTADALSTVVLALGKSVLSVIERGLLLILFANLLETLYE